MRNEEMKAKERRKMQMAENINESLKMRYEKDAELASRILKNEESINRLGKGKKDYIADLPSMIYKTEPIDLNPTPLHNKYLPGENVF